MVPDCYSPFQNLEQTYQQGSVGCSCDTPSEAICIGPAALYCTPNNAGSFVWQAVEDGVCARAVRDCSDGTVTPDARECLQDYDECYELDSGEFCGVPPITEQ